MVLRNIGWFLVFAIGCDGKATGPGESGTAPNADDADADTDVDADSDTDTDADVDYDPIGCVDEDLGDEAPASVEGSTEGAGDDRAATCGGAGAPDVVYGYTAPVDGDYVFDTVGSTYDALVAVWDSCVGAERGCDDDHALNFQGRVRTTLSAGQHVVVAVDGYEGAGGHYVLNVTQPAVAETECSDRLDEDFDLLTDCMDRDCRTDPDCDPGCPSATVSALPAVIAGSTVGELDQWKPSCSDYGNSDQTYLFVAPNDGRFVFWLDPAGTDFDSVLELRWGCGGGWTGLCDDEGYYGTELLLIDLLAGEEVLAIVDGWNGASGSFVLDVVEAPPTEIDCSDGLDEDFDSDADCDDWDDCGLAANCVEDCENQIDDDQDGATDCFDAYCSDDPLCTVTCPEETLSGPLPIVVTGSTLWLKDDWTPTTCSNNESWASDTAFSFVPPADGLYIFDTTGSNFDTQVYITEGCGGTEIACNDDGPVGGPSLIEVQLTGGEEVIVVVDGFYDGSGNYTLTVSQ